MVLQQILTILTTSPGNLIVHLALAFGVIATLQAVLATRRGIPPSSLGRLVFGLNAILIGQVILFASSGLAWQGLADPHTFIPPLDRALTAWSLAWIAWMWLFPRKPRLADIIIGIFNLIIVVGLLFTLTAWRPQAAAQPFNFSWYDWGWTGFIILISFISLILLWVDRPEGWGIGTGLFVLFLAGAALHIMYGDLDSDYPGWIRLAQLCSYALLPALAQRHVSFNTEPETIEPIASPEPQIDERRRYTTDPRAVHAWLQVADQQDPQKLQYALTKAVGQTMLADLCFLAPNPGQSGVVLLQHGYDLLRDEELPEFRIPADHIPAIHTALQRSRYLRLTPESSISGDLNSLTDVLALEGPGSLLFIPLSAPQKQWGGILLLTPYSNRVWTAADQNYLVTATESIVKILDRTAAAPLQAPVVAQLVPSLDNPQLRQELETLTREFDQLQVENNLLIKRLEQLEQSPQTSPELQSLLAVQRETEELVNQLKQDNENLQERLLNSTTQPAEPEKSSDDYEGELRLALEETAHLQNAIAGANMKILALEMQSRHISPIDPQSLEVIASTVQELRQPITSIMGYTDLIMSESVGILGTLQRKFLERIRSSTERMKGLLDDLIMVTALEGKMMEVSSGLVEMSAVIDHSVEATSAQFREKELALQLDLPDELPIVSGDQDALEQIVTHLLQNAGIVTPQEGVIRLHADQTDVDGKSYLLIQVSDSGGGIAPADMPRVFWRNFRADAPLIQGVGDRGIGLSLARALVEALGGRIWVESNYGKSATFSVLIPIIERNEAVAARSDESAA